MDAKVSFQISLFEKVLRAYDTGGFTYTDVLAELKRLLSKGASPTELLDILRRRELMEPLPDYAHAEVLELLTEAIGQDEAEAAAFAELQSANQLSAEAQLAAPPMSRDRLETQPMAKVVALPTVSESVRSVEDRIARQNTDYEALTRSYDRARDAESAAVARAAALAADLVAARSALEFEQNKSRESTQALGDRIVSAEAARTRSDNALRESQRRETESRNMLASLQQEHAKLTAASKAQAEPNPQLQSELQSARAGASALAADLAGVRAALEVEQQKAREASKLLIERDAEFAALQQEHLKLVPALEARTKTVNQLETDLRSALARATTLAGELTSARTALESEQLKSREAAQAAAEKAASSETFRRERDDALRVAGRLETELQTLRKIEAAAAASEKVTQQLTKDLATVRARADAVASELKRSEDAAAVLESQRQLGEVDLHAALAELDAVKAQSNSYLEVLRTHEWHRSFEQDVTDAGIGALQTERDTLQALVASMQSRLDSHVVSAERELAPSSIGLAEPGYEAALTPLEPESDAAAPIELVTPLLESAPAFSSEGKTRVIRWAAVVPVVAVVAWFFAHHSSSGNPLPATSAPVVRRAGSVIRDCPTCPSMTVLPAGRFQQGTSDAQSGVSSFEKPQHPVAIGYPLAMSTNLVTVDEFDEFVSATGRDMQGCETYDGEWKFRAANNWKSPGFAQSGAHPVTCASWSDAAAYAQWLSSKTGHRYRLPSASEWEYAARTGGEAVQPWASDGPGPCANANVADASATRRYPGWSAFGCDDGFVYTSPVGSFKANAFGLNDMLGNVFQWTQDCWHADYTGAPADGSAWAGGNCSEHELRGGSWFSTPAYVRANYRNHFSTDYRTSSVGFRLVRDLET